VVRAQHGLDLGGVDVEAAGDDHLLEAVDDREEASLVHGHDVTGAEPAVVEGGGGLLRHTAVAVEHLRTAHEQLAALAQRDLAVEVVGVGDADVDVGEGDPDRPGPTVVRHRVADDHR